MNSESSTTLFVADVPYDVNETTFVTLFRNCDNFVSARLRTDKNDNPVGFIDFSDHSSAEAARERYQGHKFPGSDLGLNIQFAKSSGPRLKRTRDSEEVKTGNWGGGGRDYGRSERGGTSFMYPDFYNPFPGALGSYPNLYPPLPPEASSTLYVEGLPSDATEREVSHIFRPFAGYQSLRILPKESKQFPSRTYHLCFVEFDNKYQATITMHALQGYRMDKNDTKGLHISYAKTERRDRRRSPHSSSNSDRTSNSSSDRPSNHGSHSFSPPFTP